MKSIIVVLLVASSTSTVAGPAPRPFWGSPQYVEVEVVHRNDPSVDHATAFDTQLTTYDLDVIGTPAPAPNATKVLELPDHLMAKRLAPLSARRRPALAIGTRLVVRAVSATESMCAIQNPCAAPATTRASLVAIMDYVVVVDHDEARARLVALARDGWAKPDQGASVKPS